jgi:hypothetical protein
MEKTASAVSFAQEQETRAYIEHALKQADAAIIEIHTIA